MNIAAAYEYVDLMIDKANQPYFLNTEKDIFINLSITEFLNKRYELMGVNQEYKEMIGARQSANQNSAGVTIGPGYVDFQHNFHHLTYAAVNGAECRIVSDDELTALIMTNNPFKTVNDDNPICAVTQNGNEERLYFNNGGTLDFTAADTFNIRYLRHLSVTEWDRIPEQYQHDILNITVRKMTGNIESSNYTVQANEEQQ